MKDQNHDFESKRRWYIVANRTDALFYVDGKNRRLNLIEHFCNRIGKLPEGALDSDKPGRGISSAAHGTIHHALDRTFTRYEQVAIKFAKRIAKKLAAARKEESFDELVLVAEPRFLGILKESLEARVKNRITAEVAREYPSWMTATKIRESVLSALEK